MLVIVAPGISGTGRAVEPVGGSAAEERANEEGRIVKEDVRTDVHVILATPTVIF